MKECHDEIELYSIRINHYLSPCQIPSVGRLYRYSVRHRNHPTEDTDSVMDHGHPTHINHRNHQPSQPSTTSGSPK